MELRHLRYFLAVADAEHFRRGAETLHVSQPTLSQQVQQLERELGTALFDRIGRRVRLTQAGRLFRDHARRMLRELEQAQTELDELAGLKRGRLSVGVVQTVGAFLVPRVVALFAAEHPGVTLRVEERSASDVEAGVVSGEFDLGVSFLPAEEPSLSTHLLFEEDLVLVLPAAHRWAKRSRLRVAALAGEGLIAMPRGFSTRRLMDAAFESAGVAANVAVEMNSVTAILAAVRHGRRGAILPRLALAEGDSRLKGIALEGPMPRRGVGTLLRRDRSPMRARDLFVDRLKACLASLIEGKRESGRSRSGPGQG